jgi:hypothetical protein
MRLFMYAIFDSCSGVYDRPFCANADASAIRSFGDAAGSAESVIGMHPEHFSLYRIGLFDDNTSEIVPEDAVCIARAHELVAASRKIVSGSLASVMEGAVVGNGDDSHAS